jgi:hypothetical protein
MNDNDKLAYAAYRIGIIDAMLHPEVQESLKMPGIFQEQLKGERRYRVQQLSERDVNTAMLNLEGKGAE